MWFFSKFKLLLFGFILGALLCANGCARHCYESLYCERLRNISDDTLFLHEYGSIPPERRELTYREVIDRVMCKNLEMHVKELDVRIAYETATRESLRLLPHYEIGYDYRHRNNNPGSASESLVPGIPPAPPSVSTERRLQIWNHRFYWNLIDFGIAYFVTRQASSSAVVTKMEYERLRQNLILRATEQYWVAITARKAILGSESILEKVDKQQRSIDKFIAAKIIPRITGLENQATLLDVKYVLQKYELMYKEAMQNLGELMGVPPGEEFTLRIPVLESEEIDLVDVSAVEDLALYQRPELYAKEAEVQVRADEVRAALLRMLPDLEPYFAFDYNSNFYLVENQWMTVGLRLAWDLFNIPNYYQEARVAGKKRYREVVDRLKVSMSVLAQLHMAYLRFFEEKRQLGIVRERSEVKNQLVDAARKEVLYGEFEAFQFLQYEKESLIALIQYYETYGRMMYAIEEINNAMGLPLYFTRGERYE